MNRLARGFYERDPLDVAPDLLNKLLVVSAGPDRLVARIVEVEAYRGSEDPASHAYRGSTPRNATMFGPPGHLYVYFTYGMHHCANVVCWPPGRAGAVLLRAAAPLSGLEAMRRARAREIGDRELLNGPAKLCKALGLTRQADGIDLVSGASGVWVGDDGVEPPADPAVGVRVGIRNGTELPWRWWVRGDVHVSRPLREIHSSWSASLRA